MYINVHWLALSWLLVSCLSRSCLCAITPENLAIVQKSWQQFRSAVDDVSINHAPISTLLAHALQHNFTLSYEQLRKGLAYRGHAYRLRHVVQKLINGGQQVKLAVVGGSITAGSDNLWWTRFARFVASAFPQSNVVSRNGAIPGRGSNYAATCLEMMIDDDVDAVFVEYIVNDGFRDSVMKNEIREVYEVLIRKILKKPHKPAVILMQVPAHGMGFESGEFLRDQRPYYQTIEDLYGAVAQYYDLTWLSLRDTFWRLGRLHKEGYIAKDFYKADFLHPGGKIGQEVMADLGALLFVETAMDLLLHPWSEQDQAMWDEPMPPPLHANNYEPTSLLCIHNEAFKSVVVLANGFTFINEGTATKPKWGYVSNTVGSELHIQVNTIIPSMPRDHTVDVLLGYLKSYVHMGTAKVRCISGCTCPPVELQGHHNERNSQVFLLKLTVTQADKCKLSATVTEPTLSQEHKVKISGIMIASHYKFEDEINQGGAWQALRHHADNAAKWAHDQAVGHRHL